MESESGEALGTTTKASRLTLLRHTSGPEAGVLREDQSSEATHSSASRRGTAIGHLERRYVLMGLGPRRVARSPRNASLSLLMPALLGVVVVGRGAAGESLLGVVQMATLVSGPA